MYTLTIKNQFKKILFGTFLAASLFFVEQGHAVEEVNECDFQIPCDPYLCPEAKQWDIFADLLVWNLQETCTQWAFNINPIFASGSPTLPFSGHYDAVLQAVTFDWNAGVRTG